MNQPPSSVQDAPALNAAIALSTGIVLSRILLRSFLIVWIASYCMALLGLLFFIIRREQLSASFLVILILIGMGWARSLQTFDYLPKDHIALKKVENRRVQLTGWIRRDPVHKTYRTEYLIETTSLQIGDTLIPVRGSILILDNERRSLNLGYGDELLVTGRPEQPRRKRNPGGFDYRAYLARSRIHLILRMDRFDSIQSTTKKVGSRLLRKIIYPCRHTFSKTINRVTSEKHRALLQALILGDRTSISPDVREQFSDAGVIHILAVSGLHVGFVLLNLMTLFGILRLPYSLRVSLTLCFLACFVLLTEAKPPVCRAALMGGLYLLGTLIERRANGLNLIGVAGLCLLSFNPGQLFDPGFQLSFAGVLSILFLLPKLESVPLILRIRHRLKTCRIANSILTLLLVSLSAQVGTLPLIVYHFGRIPLFSLPINCALVPMTAVIVSLGWITVVTGLLHPGIATIYGALTDLLLNILSSIVRCVGTLSFSSLKPPRPDLPVIMIYFTVIALILIRPSHRNRIRLCIHFLIWLNVFVWKHALESNGRFIEWIQFDVGQGDAALLRMPRRKTILIDGGIRSPFIDYGERVILPYLHQNGIRTLDAVILTHPHSDHVGGLISIVQNIRIKAVFIAGTPYTSSLYADFLKSVQSRLIPILQIDAPHSLEGFPGIRVSFLSPTRERKNSFDHGEENDQSLVVLTEFGMNRILFMGDSEKPVEKELMERYPSFSTDVLKVGHHGSLSSSSESFLLHTSPAIAVISVGENNRFGHPSERVLDRLHHLKCRVYRTDRDGAIILHCDGKRIELIQWQ